MNLQLVVANLILLMFWERMQDGGSRNEALCKEVMKALKARPFEGETDAIKHAHSQMMTLATKMIINYNRDMSREYLISQVRLASANNEILGEMMVRSMEQELNADGISQYCHELVREMRDFQRKLDYRNHLSKAISRALSADEYDLQQEARALALAIESYAVNAEQRIGSIEGVTDEVHFEDEESLADWFKQAQKEVNPDEIIKWHLQDLNRLFGKQNGGRRGEQILVAGLQHHYKSGMVMDMVRAAAMYNKPKLRDPSKKPLVLLVSTENQMTINLRTMYKKVMQVTAGISPEVKDINPAEAAGHMRKVFMQNGWHFKMIQVIPSIFGYHELEELVLTLERDGYEIILMAVDYLGMCKSTGLTVSTIAGRDKQALYNNTRQLTMRHHYVMLTPHQFSTEALSIDRDRPRKFMEEVPNRQYYHDCKTIGQEVDVEVLLHKIKIGDTEYLEVARGKHRGVDDTPIKHRYFVCLFTDLGIPDDVLAGDRFKATLDKLPSGTSGGADAYFELSEAM